MRTFNVNILFLVKYIEKAFYSLRTKMINNYDDNDDDDENERTQHVKKSISTNTLMSHNI